eukprot:scaffold47018_cov67-Phaeocystis_antarctica.AAC.2
MKDNRASRQARLVSLKQTDKEIEKLSTVWQQVKWNGHSSASGAWGRGEGLPRACVQARARRADLCLGLGLGLGSGLGLGPGGVRPGVWVRVRVWRNIARGNKELALSNVFARFQRFWRREFAWRKQQEAAFTAAKKAADDESQAMALAELAAIEAHEKEAKLSAEKSSQAKITLDGYKRDTRHSSTQRMASDLALNHLKQVRRERRSVKRRIATKDNTCAADSPAAPVASGLATEAIATAHDGSVVPLFLAVRKLRIEAEVTQARKEHGCDARNKRFAAWSLRQQTQGEKSPSPPRSSPPSPPPDQITEERFVEAEEERADDMKELLTLERELKNPNGHTIWSPMTHSEIGRRQTDRRQPGSSVQHVRLRARCQGLCAHQPERVVRIGRDQPAVVRGQQRRRRSARGERKVARRRTRALHELNVSVTLATRRPALALRLIRMGVTVERGGGIT